MMTNTEQEIFYLESPVDSGALHFPDCCGDLENYEDMALLGDPLRPLDQTAGVPFANFSLFAKPDIFSRQKRERDVGSDFDFEQPPLKRRAFEQVAASEFDAPHPFGALEQVDGDEACDPGLSLGLTEDCSPPADDADSPKVVQVDFSEEIAWMEKEIHQNQLPHNPPPPPQQPVATEEQDPHNSCSTCNHIVKSHAKTIPLNTNIENQHQQARPYFQDPFRINNGLTWVKKVLADESGIIFPVLSDLEVPQQVSIHEICNSASTFVARSNPGFPRMQWCKMLELTYRFKTESFVLPIGDVAGRNVKNQVKFRNSVEGKERIAEYKRTQTSSYKDEERHLETKIPELKNLKDTGACVIFSLLCIYLRHYGDTQHCTPGEIAQQLVMFKSEHCQCPCCGYLPQFQFSQEKRTEVLGVIRERNIKKKTQCPDCKRRFDEPKNRVIKHCRKTCLFR